jgi:uncharacterized Ntn-hydrolase superfamily protein
VAVDPETREVGIAGASCILGSEVIAALAPGRGAVVAQAFSSFAGRDHAIARIAGGESPEASVARISGRGFDSFLGIPLYKLRQYGAAALGFEGRPASFTGGR